MAFAVRCSMELVSPTPLAGCSKTCSPMAAHIHCWLNTTDHPCPFTLCTLQIGCCRGERVRSWISLLKRSLKIPRSTRGDLKIRTFTYTDMAHWCQQAQA